MKHIDSMRGLCSILSRCEETDKEVAVFLCIYGYDKRPDIVDPNASLIQLGTLVNLNTTAAREVLHKVCEEEKENGHPEVAVKAMELCLRLSDLESEAMGKNTQ